MLNRFHYCSKRKKEIKFGQVGPVGRAPEELTERWRPGLDAGKKRAMGDGGAAPRGRDGRRLRGWMGAGGALQGRAPAGLCRGEGGGYGDERRQPLHGQVAAAGPDK
jgi:hypothetical protein